MRRKERDASRGSPRSFTSQKALVQDDKLEKVFYGVIHHADF
jgi:hypothetical protein